MIAIIAILVAILFPEFAQAKGPVPRKIVLEKPFLATAGGQVIRVPQGHTAPILADFDNDGKQDLLVGEFGDGSKGATLRIYRHIGSVSKPQFDKHEMFQAGGQIAKVEGG